MSFKRSEWKRKKAISQSTVNSHRIGITLKLETVRKLVIARSKKSFTDVFYSFHFISESEIIHIFMYFTETRQLGLEQVSAKYGNATKQRTTAPTNYF